MVDRVVDARDQVELAEDRQAAHVGDEHVRAPRGLRARRGHHLRRDVAGGDVEAAVQQRHEALAGAATDVQQSPAGEPVSDRQPLDRGQPRSVGVLGGQEVVGGGKHGVGTGRVRGESVRLMLGRPP